MVGVVAEEEANLHTMHGLKLVRMVMRPYCSNNPSTKQKLNQYTVLHKDAVRQSDIKGGPYIIQIYKHMR